MKTIKTVWNIITTILVLVVVILAMLLVGMRLFGLQVYTVLSGSMEPLYQTGSLIYVQKVEPYTVVEGQVITFMLDEDTLATHRVIEVVPDENDPTVVRYRTKGDANDAEDGSLVHYKNVVGTPLFTIPKLGYLANYIQNPPGMYIAIAAGAMLILLVFLPDLLTDESTEEEPVRRRKKKKKKPAAVTAPAKPSNGELVEKLLAMEPAKLKALLARLDETDPEKARALRKLLVAELTARKAARESGKN